MASLSAVVNTNSAQRPSPSTSSLSTYTLSKGTLATGATGNSTLSPYLQEQQRSLLHSQLATGSNGGGGATNDVVTPMAHSHSNNPPLDHFSTSLPRNHHHTTHAIHNSTRQRPLRSPAPPPPNSLSNSHFHHVSYHPKDTYRPVPPQMGAGAILGRRSSFGSNNGGGSSSRRHSMEGKGENGDGSHQSDGNKISSSNYNNNNSSNYHTTNSSNNSSHIHHDSQSSSTSYRRDSNSSQRDNSSHDTPTIPIHRRDNRDNIHMLSQSISGYERMPRHNNKNTNNNNVHFSLNEKRHGFGLDNTDDQSFGTNDSFRRDLRRETTSTTRRESKMSQITDSSSENNTTDTVQNHNMSAAIPIPHATRNLFGKKIRKSHSRTDLVREMALDRNARRNNNTNNNQSKDKLLEMDETSSHNSPRRNSSFLSFGNEDDLDKSGGNRSTVGPLPESSLMDGLFHMQSNSSQSLQLMQETTSGGGAGTSTTSKKLGTGSMQQMSNLSTSLHDASQFQQWSSDAVASSNLSTSIQQSYQFPRETSAGSAANNNSSAGSMQYSSNLSTSLQNSLQFQQETSMGGNMSNLSTNLHNSSQFQRGVSSESATSNLSTSMHQSLQFQQDAAMGAAMNGLNNSMQHSPQLQGITGMNAPSGLSNSSMQRSPQLQGATGAIVPGSLANNSMHRSPQLQGMAGMNAPGGLSNSSMQHSPQISQLTTPTLGPSNLSLNSTSGAPSTAVAQTPLAAPISRNQIMQPGWFPHHSEQDHLMRASHISRRFSAGSQSTVEAGNLAPIHNTMDSGDNTNIMNQDGQQMNAASGPTPGDTMSKTLGVAARQMSSSNCDRCSHMEMTLLSLQADVEYLRTLELQREFLCTECQPSSRSALKKHAKSKKASSHLSSKLQPPSIPENPSDGKSESSAVSAGSKASSRVPSLKLKRPSAGSIGGTSRSSLRGTLPMGATRTAAFLREASKRLADLSTRHKQQVKQTTHERAYWQNDMHLKLEKFAMMAKNLNEEAAKRNIEVKETKATLEKVTSERNGLISQVEMLKARVALYEEESVDYEKMRKEWENVELQTLAEMENTRKNQDDMIRDLSMRLDLAVKTIEAERRQQQQRRQIIFPASRQNSSSTSRDNSPSSPHHKAAAATESLNTEHLESIKATSMETARKYQQMLESSMAQSASREKELQDRVEALEKELEIVKVQESPRGKLPGSASTASL